MKRLLLTVVVLAFGCAVSSAGATDRRDGPLAESRTALAADYGCTTNLPMRWTVRKDWSSLVQVCGNADSSSVGVKNLSRSIVVRISNVHPDGIYTDFVLRDLALDLQSQATERIVGAMCVHSSYCVPPGRTYVVERLGGTISSMDFQIAYKTSFAARAGATLAGMLDVRSRLVPASVSSIVSCAKEVGTLANQSQDVTFEDTAFTAISGYRDCSSVAQLFKETGPAERKSLAQRATALANRFGGGLFEDFIRLDAFKLLRR